MFKINLKECERETVDEYKTFCDFFTRKLKDGIHKIDEDKKSVVSSCDGKILEYGKIKNNSILQVKGKYILIEDLLGNNNDSIDHYKNGSFVTIYLSPKDYHRVHMPMTGKLSMTTYVPGRLYSVALHAVNTIKNLYSRNERLVCSFKNNNIYFTVVFIAAINVSSIETVWSGEVSPPAPKKIIKSNFEKRKMFFHITSLRWMYHMPTEAIFFNSATESLDKSCLFSFTEAFTDSFFTSFFAGEDFLEIPETISFISI